MYKKSYYKVAIIGLGYVGLPLYLLIKSKKLKVYGLDNDNKKIRLLNKNISTNSDIPNYRLKAIKNKDIFNIDKKNILKNCNVVIFCLPTPLTKKNKPDLSYIKNAFDKIKNQISRDTLLILESTVYPGATREIFENYIKKNYANFNDVNFGFSSERISPGQIGDNYKIKYHDITKVLSINDLKFKNKIQNFYKIFFKKTHLADTIEIAEMSKLLENSYRSVNIGLINEIKKICINSNLDIHKVIEAAATKPFGFTAFTPGPGVGGHCIPIDPVFVSWFAKKNNTNSNLIDLARKTNLETTSWVYSNITKIIENSKKNKLLILGITYKENINDYRESPALKIIKSLLKEKYSFDYYDTYVDKIKIGKKNLKSIKNLNNIKNYQLCVLLTAHDNFPYNLILKNSKLILDTRGKFQNMNTSKVIFS